MVATLGTLASAILIIIGIGILSNALAKQKCKKNNNKAYCKQQHIQR